MTERAVRMGACELCRELLTKARMLEHVEACVPRHATEAPSANGGIVQLQVEATGAPDYWLLIEGREDATLQQLDTLLRKVWLECCGHMSAFRLGRAELPKRARLGEVCAVKGARFGYEYDFGDTTALTGKAVGFRDGSLGRRAVRLLARNAAIEWKCESCGSPAELICPFCANEGPSLFCKKDAPAHECHDQGAWLPVVNSPRMGVCGYAG